MSGISVTVDATDLDQAFLRLKPIFAFEPSELMTAIGAVGESQTRRRISDEKTAPDGTPWQANRHGGSILQDTGQHLLASVAWTANADTAEWGAAWEFAHVHQYGAVIVPTEAKRLAFMAGGAMRFAKKVTIPARPFVGLSTDNIAEIIDVVSDHFGMLQ